jgi:hypothetical protein
MAADWPAGARLLAVAPAGQSAASYTTTWGTTSFAKFTGMTTDAPPCAVLGRF